MASRMGTMLCRAAVCLGLVCHATSATTSPSRETAALCEGAAARASQATGVPLDVLRAISLTETDLVRALERVVERRTERCDLGRGP